MQGQEKAQVLLSLLEDNSQNVLSSLDSASAQQLLSSVGSVDALEGEELQSFLIDVLDQLDKKRQAQLFAPPMEEPVQEPATEPEEPVTETFASLESDEPFFESGESEQKPERDPTLRSSSFIARLVSEQKPQVRAFFLSRIDDDLRNEIMTFLPDEVIADYESREIEEIPLSDKVFETLYEELCRKSPEDDPEDNEDSLESDSDFPNFF
jgi:flagellar motor switch protein FliG